MLWLVVDLNYFENLTPMRVRKVQEQEIPDLPKRLLAARKASDMSLLEICRQLDISATYWYKLEREETSTISYELLSDIDRLLSLGLNLDLSQSLTVDKLSNKEHAMNLSRLKWIKVVTPPQEVGYRWAYSPDHIKNMSQENQTIHHNGLTIFPVGFKREGLTKLNAGDLIALTQHAKITHIVEILDDQPYEEGGWFHRFVKVVWWKPDIDWDLLPHRKYILGFDVQVQQSIPYEFTTSFSAFKEFWGEKGGLDAFQADVAEQLIGLG